MTSGHLSTKRAIAFVWALGTSPVAFGALFLLFVGITVEGRLFSLAMICLIAAPIVEPFRILGSGRKTGIALLLSGVILLTVCFFRSPSEEDGKSGPAQVLYLKETNHNRLSPAGLVPEADQQILAAWLFGVIDPLIDGESAKRLRKVTIELGREFLADEDLRHLPSTMGLAYADLFTGSRPVGNLFTYVPARTPADAQLPVILFLHGSLGNFQPYWVILKELADRANVAIVAPTFGAGNWYLEGGMDAVRHAVDFCTSHPQVNASKIHLAGLSNGGTGVTRAAATFPDSFQSLMLLSAITEIPVLKQKGFLENWRGMPVLQITGTADRRVPVKTIRRAHDFLLKEGVAVQSHYLEGGNHFIFYTRRDEIVNLLEKWIARSTLSP